MDKESALLLLKLRLNVGYLGERAQYDWWPTAFFEQSGRTFLDPVFSRTAIFAKYHGVIQAASRVHDEHLSLGCFHLFRLPELQEQDLHEKLRDIADSVGDYGIEQGKVASLAALEQLVGTARADVTGPVAVGKIEDLEKTPVLYSMARAYLGGFKRQAPVFPYLVAST